MQRTRRFSMLTAILMAISLIVVPSVPSLAQDTAPIAPQGALDDEIALIEYPSGMIRIDDPYQPPGVAKFEWNSGADDKWGNLAVGDFNGDGDAELAAIRAGTLKVFDPLVQPGSDPVTFETTLTSPRVYQLLATGDVDHDGRDEIVVTHTETGGARLELWDGGGSGTIWTRTRTEYFGGAWQALAVGDMNNDGYADVALERIIDQRIKVYDGAIWIPPLAEQSGYAGEWLTLALGNLSNTYPGVEMALTRKDVPVPDFANLVMLRLSTGGLANLVDLTPYSYSPPFTSISLGDANGDGDDEVLLLRDPLVDKTSLQLVNPAGASMRDFKDSIGWGGTAWKQVRSGDVDGDGRDEPVVLRSDRYRIYWQPELDNYTGPDYLGNFLIPSDSDRPTIALGDFDGQGLPSDGNVKKVFLPLVLR